MVLCCSPFQRRENLDSFPSILAFEASEVVRIPERAWQN